MITKMIQLITSALSPSTNRKAIQGTPSVLEASNNYAQGEYFEQLASIHHQSYLLHPNHQSDLSTTDYRNAMWNFLSAALKGHKEAQYKLGIGYLNGDLGLERNYTLAELWLKKAEAQGHHLARQALHQAHADIVFS